ncbi:MAG: hypothetical protein RLZZ618_111 [Pseudomonadota bacterium]|jgi:hypothetical protein
MLKLKGGITAKTIKAEQVKVEKERQQQEADGIWAMVIPRRVLTDDGWTHASGSWYSPNRDISGGYHLHLVSAGEEAGWVRINALFYTNSANAAHGGRLNFMIALDFDWVEAEGRIVVRPTNANLMQQIHANQRPHLVVLVANAMVMPLDHLT